MSDNSTIGDPSVTEDASAINNAGNNIAANALDQVKRFRPSTSLTPLGGWHGFALAPVTYAIDFSKIGSGGVIPRRFRSGSETWRIAVMIHTRAAKSAGKRLDSNDVSARAYKCQPHVGRKTRGNATACARSSRAGKAERVRSDGRAGVRGKTSAESSGKNKHLYSRRPWTEMGRGNRTDCVVARARARASAKPRRARCFYLRTLPRR